MAALFHTQVLCCSAAPFHWGCRTTHNLWTGVLLLLEESSHVFPIPNNSPKQPSRNQARQCIIGQISRSGLKPGTHGMKESRSRCRQRCPDCAVGTRVGAVVAQIHGIVDDILRPSCMYGPPNDLIDDRGSAHIGCIH